MPSTRLLRLQIEAALADRIPSALTPAPRVIHPTAPTGIAALDERLGGGLPIGTISELAGSESSGRTSLALSFIAGMTQAARVCAWVDVFDTLDPESAAAIGVDLGRLLWVRCGAPSQALDSQQLTLPGRTRNPPDAPEQLPLFSAPGLATAKQPPAVCYQNFAPRCAEPQLTIRQKSREVVSLPVREYPDAKPLPALRKVPWSRLDQALRVTDLLLQGGGFSAIVLDMGSVAPEYALRVPLATWFRYRAAAERTHVSFVLLTQQACTKSSAGLVLCLQPGQIVDEGSTVFTGAEYRIEIARERFAKVVDFARKPPQSDHSIHWQSRASWAGRHTDRTGGPGRK